MANICAVRRCRACATIPPPGRWRGDGERVFSGQARARRRRPDACASNGSPREVNVVALVYDLLRSGATRGRSVAPRPGDERRSIAGCDHNVDSSALEVERVRDATHAAVALRRAATAGNTSSRPDVEQASEVQFGMGGEPPLRQRVVRIAQAVTSAPDSVIVTSVGDCPLVWIAFRVSPA